jgi:hypothetical protein
MFVFPGEAGDGLMGLPDGIPGFASGAGEDEGNDEGDCGVFTGAF